MDARLAGDILAGENRLPTSGNTDILGRLEGGPKRIGT